MRNSRTESLCELPSPIAITNSNLFTEVQWMAVDLRSREGSGDDGRAMH
jgi:hypothetical protein